MITQCWYDLNFLNNKAECTDIFLRWIKAGILVLDFFTAQLVTSISCAVFKQTPSESNAPKHFGR